jgi:pyridoxal phosphate enzyme (YggS family)
MTDDEIRAILAERVNTVRSRIAAACGRVGRSTEEVTLVAVTKTVSSRVASFLPELGILDLGENRPQELWRKAEELKHLPIRWHMIGHLQRNKVERTLPLVHLTHAVDSLRLIKAIAAEGHRSRVLLQVNGSKEEQKHGFDFEELFAATAEIERASVEVQGLMTMAAYSDEPENARPTFAALRQFRDRLRGETGWRVDLLSMGMSGDFEVAIEEGATIVRVGNTLFEGL